MTGPPTYPHFMLSLSPPPKANINFCILRDLWNNIVAVTGSFMRNFASVNEP